VTPSRFPATARLVRSICGCVVRFTRMVLGASRPVRKVCGTSGWIRRSVTFSTGIRTRQDCSLANKAWKQHVESRRICSTLDACAKYNGGSWNEMTAGKMMRYHVLYKAPVTGAHQTIPPWQPGLEITGKHDSFAPCVHVAHFMLVGPGTKRPLGE
jgi:hypothetical protein